MRYYFISDNSYFLSGINTICEDTGLAYTPVHVCQEAQSINIPAHPDDVAVVFLTQMMKYEALLTQVHEQCKTALFVVDGEIENLSDSSILISASISVPNMVVALLKANTVARYIPPITEKGRIIIEGLYLGKSILSISQSACIKEKSVYASRRNILKLLGLGKMNSASGLIIAYNILLQRARFTEGGMVMQHSPLGHLVFS